MTFVLILAAIATAIAGGYLLAVPKKETGRTVSIPDHEMEVKQAVKDLPMIDEGDNGDEPSCNAELSHTEAVLLGSEPDYVSDALARPEGRAQLAELGYELAPEEKTGPAELETMIDAFDDGRGFFPAPETPAMGDEFTPPDNQ